MAEMILFSISAQAVDTEGWTPLMVWIYAIVTVIGPWVLAALGAWTLWLKLRSVEKGINGRMTQLLATKDEKASAQVQAAHAEGKLEGKSEAPAPPPPIIVVPPVLPVPPPTPRDPQTRTRAADRTPPEPPVP